MSSYYLETYQPPKNQLPSKVHRFPLYRRAKPAPAAPPPPPEPPKEKPKEKPAPAPEWSKWQRIKGTQWDGWWRASGKEGVQHHIYRPFTFIIIPADQVYIGEWTYQFTKDGTTIWQQKPVATEASSSAKTAGEPVRFGETAATALTPATNTYALSQPSPSLLVPPSSSSTTAMTVDDGMGYASYHDAAPPIALTARSESHDVSTLTVKTNSEDHPTTGAQASSPAHAADQIRPSQQSGGSDGYSNSTHYQNYYSSGGAHRHVGTRSHSYDQRNSVFYSQEAHASSAASTAQKGDPEHHAAHKEERKARHAASPRSQKANRYPKTIGEVVSKEKGKSFNSKSIVENWQWG